MVLHAQLPDYCNTISYLGRVTPLPRTTPNQHQHHRCRPIVRHCNHEKRHPDRVGPAPMVWDDIELLLARERRM
jgi:hypothetical protein